MYTGNADWTLIGEIKKNPRIQIPIIGNGDITNAEEAKAAFDNYGVDAIMVGRATFGRPWIFKEINDCLEGKEPQPLSVDEKIDLLEEQLKINVERIDEYCTLVAIWLPALYSREYQTSAKYVSPCLEPQL